MKKNVVIVLGLVILVGISTFGLGMLVTSLMDEINIPEESYLFVDSKNREVYVPKSPQKIVSMAPSITETIFALGAENKLVGITDYCNYPIEALNRSNYTSIGGFSTPNLEIIADLDPDLIITSTWNPDIIEQIEAQGMAIVVIFADTLEEIIENVGVIANLVNFRQNGIYLTGNLTYNMESITDKTASLNYTQIIDCYFEIYCSPMVAGAKSYVHDMILKAGAINIFGNINQEYSTVSHEQIIDGDPDVIFLTAHYVPYYPEPIYERSGYDSVNACINNRIYQCDDDMYLRPGPRIIDALENMTRYLYPFLF
ncbi:MAG: ABC transporter substrate-binding protein [Candidatus Lokiarchaeota archaeon]|nr:ABC transporter substrate-binding protein [Candidatus Lokiarchaeota archaeon]